MAATREQALSLLEKGKSCCRHPSILIGFVALVGALAATLSAARVNSACIEANNSDSGATKLLFGLFEVNKWFCSAAANNVPWFLFTGIAAAPSILLTWYWRHSAKREDIRIAQESGIATRYKEAAALLSVVDNASATTRGTGVMLLWDIARESKSHRETVAETLAMFVRAKCAYSADVDRALDPEMEHYPSPDVQVALHRLSDRSWDNPDWFGSGGRRRLRIDLRKTDLGGADLTDAALPGSLLDGAFLFTAHLPGANLSGASLVHANLRYADLSGANLSGANLSGADLVGAMLTQAQLDEIGAWNDMTSVPEGFILPPHMRR